MNAVGLKRGVVELQEYNWRWKRVFEKERKRLEKALKDLVIDIQHVGSTAIPGIPAKPIIDIAVGVKNLKDVEEVIRRIEGLGYEYKKDRGSPERMFFAKGSENRRTHHLHLIQFQGEEWRRMILFRDYLCSHPNWAKRYADLKRKLAQKFVEDRESYTKEKSRFVEKVLERCVDNNQ